MSTGRTDEEQGKGIKQKDQSPRRPQENAKGPADAPCPAPRLIDHRCAEEPLQSYTWTAAPFTRSLAGERGEQWGGVAGVGEVASVVA